jgi:hypothetical protein
MGSVTRRSLSPAASNFQRLFSDGRFERLSRHLNSSPNSIHSTPASLLHELVLLRQAAPPSPPLAIFFQLLTVSAVSVARLAIRIVIAPPLCQIRRRMRRHPLTKASLSQFRRHLARSSGGPPHFFPPLKSPTISPSCTRTSSTALSVSTATPMPSAYANSAR